MRVQSSIIDVAKKLNTWNDKPENNAGRIDPDNNTPECMRYFMTEVKVQPTAGELRMAMHLCDRVDPLSAGYGLGYNVMVVPGKQRGDGEQPCDDSPLDRSNGRELVLPNLAVKNLVDEYDAQSVNRREENVAEVGMSTFTITEYNPIDGLFSTGFTSDNTCVIGTLT